MHSDLLSQTLDIDMVNPNIRPACIGEHEALTDLSLRSVRDAWNYSDEFMAWEPEAIIVTPEHIVSDVTRVLDLDGNPIGFYVLKANSPDVEMSRLMIAPDATGQGYGRLLWDHAVETARTLGAEAMTLDADPNAEPFYQRMGAETTGEHTWEPPMMPGWRLKKMRYKL